MKEKIVGWYSTGPKLRQTDISINEQFRQYCSNPVLVIVDVNPNSKRNNEIPTNCYVAVDVGVDERIADATAAAAANGSVGQTAAQAAARSKRTWQHLPSEIGAYEAEEVGVEHLLRNIKVSSPLHFSQHLIDIIQDTTVTSVADQIDRKAGSLRALHTRLIEIQKYLDAVLAGSMPVSQSILSLLQEIFNARPDLSHKPLVEALQTQINDGQMMLMLASIFRSTLSIDATLTNRLENRHSESVKLKAEAN